MPLKSLPITSIWSALACSHTGASRAVCAPSEVMMNWAPFTCMVVAAVVVCGGKGGETTAIGLGGGGVALGLSQ